MNLMVFFPNEFNEFFLYPHICFSSYYRTNSTRDSSKTLIDVFSNTSIGNNISGNLTATVSDHLPQFYHFAKNFP